MRDRNRLLRDQVRDPRWFDVLEHRMADAGARITAGRRAAIARLHAAQTEAQTAFPSAELTLDSPPEAPLPETAVALRAALAGARAGDMRAGRTRLGPHRCDRPEGFRILDRVHGAGHPVCQTHLQGAEMVPLQ